jgi:beta-galactosidase
MRFTHYHAAALFAFGCSIGAAAPRDTYNFNPGWLLKSADESGAEAASFADADWKQVTLPHAWNEDSAFKVNNKKLPAGIAWYRKHFNLPADAAGRKVFLEFEGIRQAGEFYLNGEFIGRSENGVMAFGFDITDKLKPGENVLAARIDNSTKYAEKATGSMFQWNVNDFAANYGGIPKNVRLHVTDKLYQTLPLYSNLGTTGVYVHAQDFDIKGRSAKVTAETQVKNEHAGRKKFSYEVTITGPDGKLVQTIQGGEQTLGVGQTKTVSASARVSDLNFWSWGYGYLYDVATTLKVDGKPVDTVVTRTGFRKLEFANGMVKLNDRTIQMKGYAQRSTNEWPAVGQSVPPWLSDFSNDLMVESNANLVRWMHVTPGKQDIESCDRVGLLQAMPAGDKEKDAEGRQWIQRIELMRDAIIYNRNNPSVVFYEGGNESISEAHMADLKAVRDQYDPHGGRASGSREMLDSKVAEYGGEMLYINKSAHIPFWATEYCRDEALRKYWDEWTPPFHKDGDGPPAPKGESGAPYNRNQDSYAVTTVERWYDYWRERAGTGIRSSAGGVNIVFSDTNTHGRGAENYRRSGEVDAMRIPKDAFYAHQVMWNGWVDVEKPAAYIVGHWNYEPTVKKPVYVISSADKVELFVNGKSLGFGIQSSRFLYTWKEVQFKPGSIKAVGYDATGKKLCESEKRTAGVPVALRLASRTAPGGLLADGADMALVQIEVIDAQGNRCPTAFNPVNFELTGPAEWRGGIAQGPDNCILSKTLPAECGVNRVLIRSLPQAGKIAIKASAQGLKPASIELASKPLEVKDGLSTVFPAANLPASLKRGPTPSGDSVTPTRKPLRIAGAAAGAKAEEVGKTFDDNENTSWKNDGKRDTAWIQFELERSATVSEITLKLGGWRNKSYPLRVTVDGKQAYVGTTPKSLGYVTLPLKPTPGKAVRIELVGAIDEKDGFGMVEVTGKKLDDTKDSGGKGILEIVEVEIYGPVTPSKR